jgi:hypothetical protein
MFKSLYRKYNNFIIRRLEKELSTAEDGMLKANIECELTIRKGSYDIDIETTR